MTPAPWFCRFAFAFGIAFAAFYVVAVKFDLALFTVYPSIRVVLLGTHHSRDSVGPSMGSFLPAMYWYGWTATAALGALISGVGAALLPGRWSRLFWSGWLWVIPVAAMIGCVYLTLPWFRLELRMYRPRERAPDDRLREAIHVSARRTMDCFASRAMTMCRQ